MSPRSHAVDVLVVSWNSAQTLRQCLESVHGTEGCVRVLVIDNASMDDSLDCTDAAALVVAMAQNLGFARAVNALLAECNNEYALLLNPDVIVDSHTVGRSIDLLEHTGAGIVGANLRTADGTPDRAAARRFKSMRTVLLETLGLPRLSSRFDWQYFPGWDRTDSREVPCVNGAFMLMRTELLRDMGGLDESVFMYLEDLDLCWRVRERGLAVWFCADAMATHVGGASTAAGNVDQQAIAHLHRLDGTIEFIVRTSRFGKRPVLIGLLFVQTIVGMIHGAVTRDRVQFARHRRALRWLPRQLRSRTPPPPVSS
ncbi:MAG: glycosyltransferase family 2 protein [Acidimicrobiales bacterium]|nr:glycosyltransferase family 2 protein [Acidimicrobiales bacterium]